MHRGQARAGRESAYRAELVRGGAHRSSSDALGRRDGSVSRAWLSRRMDMDSSAPNQICDTGTKREEETRSGHGVTRSDAPEGTNPKM